METLDINNKAEDSEGANVCFEENNVSRNQLKQKLRTHNIKMQSNKQCMPEASRIKSGVSDEVDGSGSDRGKKRRKTRLSLPHQKDVKEQATRGAGKKSCSINTIPYYLIPPLPEYIRKCVEDDPLPSTIKTLHERVKYLRRELARQKALFKYTTYIMPCERQAFSSEAGSAEPSFTQ